jgi:hypothetical protein
MKFQCGRGDYLSGSFVAFDEDVALLISSKMPIAFGEVLGKHSYVCGPIEQSEITKVTDDKHVVEIFENHDLKSGFNPFYYPVDYEWKEEKCWDDDILVYEGLEILEKENLNDSPKENPA